MKAIKKFLDNLLSICIYMLIFSNLIYFAMPGLSLRVCYAFGFILGFFAGAINNIERVLRELFDKDYTKE